MADGYYKDMVVIVGQGGGQVGGQQRRQRVLYQAGQQGHIPAAQGIQPPQGQQGRPPLHEVMRDAHEEWLLMMRNEAPTLARDFRYTLQKMNDYIDFRRGQ